MEQLDHSIFDLPSSMILYLLDFIEQRALDSLCCTNIRFYECITDKQRKPFRSIESRRRHSVIVERGMLSRLLYPNPVCLLLTSSPRNVMTITWITPVNNKGEFFFSMHQNRFTHELLRNDPSFGNLSRSRSVCTNTDRAKCCASPLRLCASWCFVQAVRQGERKA
jgi:hypothetical protein